MKCRCFYSPLFILLYDIFTNHAESLLFYKIYLHNSFTFFHALCILSELVFSYCAKHTWSCGTLIGSNQWVVQTYRGKYVTSLVKSRRSSTFSPFIYPLRSQKLCSLLVLLWTGNSHKIYVLFSPFVLEIKVLAALPSLSKVLLIFVFIQVCVSDPVVLQCHEL